MRHTVKIKSSDMHDSEVSSVITVKTNSWGINHTIKKKKHCINCFYQTWRTGVSLISSLQFLCLCGVFKNTTHTREHEYDCFNNTSWKLRNTHAKYYIQTQTNFKNNNSLFPLSHTQLFLDHFSTFVYTMLLRKLHTLCVTVNYKEYILVHKLRMMCITQLNTLYI